jgi:ABC-type transport system involved in Fe-S cluster assembly fused permease/ATPase subunit
MQLRFYESISESTSKYAFAEYSVMIAYATLHFVCVSQASLTDAIARMPKGFDTVVGERGLMLSGGEKQRVAIARAMLKNAPILLCDEPTSALDSRTEAGVMTRLKALGANRTTLIIAHRLSTVQDADEIVVLDKGRVVEQGPHAALLAKPGSRYAAMWQTQQALLEAADADATAAEDFKLTTDAEALQQKQQQQKQQQPPPAQ